MVQYLPIVLMLALAALFAAGSFVASAVLGPKRPTAAKEGPYESGIVPRRAPAARFPVRFYLVAMIFIIFDIEVVFLYPWAVMYRQLAGFGLAEMAVFVGIVFVSFAYLVSNGALDWGPVQKLRNRPRADLTRTTSTAVRRVPRPIEVAMDGPGLLPLDGDGAGGDRVGADGGGSAGGSDADWGPPVGARTGEER
ncbi:MAG TPA: NADH-quinone oxidoreductase subunit A [Acidimicrobiales bacterium]|nr:NADH-quinone oxidoreductase subunit A [Acidimicrobiales bacterium]